MSCGLVGSWKTVVPPLGEETELPDIILVSLHVFLGCTARVCMLVYAGIQVCMSILKMMMSSFQRYLFLLRTLPWVRIWCVGVIRDWSKLGRPHTCKHDISMVVVWAPVVANLVWGANLLTNTICVGVQESAQGVSQCGTSGVARLLVFPHSPPSAWLLVVESLLVCSDCV
jgi:hypothetical protein